MTLPRALLFAFMALCCCLGDARRHRYGHSNLQRRQVTTRPSRGHLDDDQNASMESIETDVVVEARDHNRNNDEVRSERWLSGTATHIPFIVCAQWPPRWTQPVLIVGTLWYSSLFFT